MFQSPARLLLVLLVFSGVNLLAQTGTTSNPTNGRENNPYSKYGIGELINGNSTVLKGMGSATSAFANPYEINSDNPASYSFLQRTTFEIGAEARMRTVTGQIGGVDQSYKTGTASLAYLNFGFPVGKHAGLCMGFKPYARTFYNMNDTTFNSPIGEVIKSYNGDGSLNYAYLGGAYNYKGFSLGFNVGYMFGTLQNATVVIPFDTLVVNQAFTTQYTNTTRIGNLYWKGGAMYEHKLDSNYTFRIGGTITLSQKLKERFDAYQISTYNFGDTIARDTSYNPGTQTGKLTLPMSFSVGVMVAKNDKWSLAADYTSTKWSGYNSQPNTDMNFNIAAQSYKVSLGGEITPDINDIHSYFSRVTYRLGFYYGTDYLSFNNTSLPYYGVTAGGSLPFRRSLSRLHFAFDIGRLGTTTANNLLQEGYVRFNVGISLNDRWFIPRKYD